ncbi:hypothetical protein H2201_003346 [Coniosporium apollinis]|uniref:Calponin-homology (CH) domain-containing protein n=1 Tax=Coniosporium apollinis TaxID=61459 RepID=A0ABQ9NYQ3_9PEZI|nr:hypothetical protein H2201_003346 [Coniosporium apollinis]
MRRYYDATPCPATYSGPRHMPPYYRNHTTLYAPSDATNLYTQDDTTANIEYTREIRTHIQHAKPRRCPAALRKSAWNPATDIFQDVAEESPNYAAAQSRKSRGPVHDAEQATGRNTVLSQPPQRSTIAPQRQKPVQPSRRRVSTMLAERERQNPEGRVDSSIVEGERAGRSEAKKDPRRRTIYIPSEDTTIVTIHPGAPLHKTRAIRDKSPDLAFDLFNVSEGEPENLKSALRQSKTARKSLAAAPKRVPLQRTTRPLQSVSFSEDVVGRNGGKENIPPGKQKLLVAKEDIPQEKENLRSSKHLSKLREAKHGKIARAAEDARPVLKSIKELRAAKAIVNKREIASTYAPAATWNKKRTSSGSISGSSPAKALKIGDNTSVNGNAHRRSRTQEPAPQAVDRPTRLSWSPKSTPPPKVQKPPSKLSVPLIVQKAAEQQAKYPLLSEDLSKPELYEDQWLYHQEVALSQLINSIFESAGKQSDDFEQEPSQLRKKLLVIYHAPEIPLLHKRLQASLLYGALSIPKELLSQASRLKDDLGLRRKFLNLWLDTYDLETLKAAVETIIGRACPVSSRLSSGSTTADLSERKLRAEKKPIEDFLDTFLVRNEDAVRIKSGVGSIASITRGAGHHEDDVGSQGWSWRRTVLRSLMLIHLLDRAKTSDTITCCLFQVSSSYKSSTAVLHALSAMLFPSLGDVVRPLGHLTYHLSCVQYPLQEYTYQISNLATDLRNGVLLTRLVELLLYPPSALSSFSDGTVTVSMPTGELLTTVFHLGEKEEWVLSQHLKVPCIGRAQKLYNVQIALSALEGVRDLAGKISEDVKAEDIVDGHREKTLGFLWGLVGKCGLGSLVDWEEVGKENHRLKAQFSEENPAHEESDFDNEDDLPDPSDLDRYAHLLLIWARNIARLHNLRVTNLTTSFANPKVLEAIVTHYLPYCTGSTSPPSSQGPPPSLSEKLKSIGCSTPFIALFAPASNSNGPYPLPTKATTVTTLAFLASRLLPLSRAHRAACAIQRAFRARLARRDVFRRITLMRLAAECAMVMRARTRVVGAAVVLQRAWRRVLDQRIGRLVEDVVGFQAVARGWATRRRVADGKDGGKRKGRVMGGW